MRLQTAETRLKELKSALMALGREATAAMLSVEEQQQQITLQSLCTLVLLNSLWKSYVIIDLTSMCLSVAEHYSLLL